MQLRILKNTTDSPTIIAEREFMSPGVPAPWPHTGRTIHKKRQPSVVAFSDISYCADVGDKNPPSDSRFNASCPSPDSNRDASRRYPLKMVCLPISPLGPEQRKKGRKQKSKKVRTQEIRNPNPRFDPDIPTRILDFLTSDFISPVAEAEDSGLRRPRPDRCP